MKILITGANGFVGRNLIEALDSNQNEVIATDINQLNILDFEKCKSVIKNIDVVVHLAAITDVPLSLEEPKKIMEVNCIGTLNVLEAMRKNKVKKIIFSSTQDVYGSNTNSKEDDAKRIAPLNNYSLSKLFCEETIKMYSRLYGINYVIFRASYLYGNYQKKGLLPLMCNRVVKNYKVEIGNNVSRDFLNVKDFVNAIIIGVSHNKNDLLNVGTGSSTSLKELCNMIAEILHKKIEIAVNKSLIREDKFERWNELANIEKIKKLGWKPKIKLKTWIRENLKNG